MFSRFIHFVACDRISFLFKAKIIFHCMYILHFLHLFITGQMGCFHFLAIVNSAAINIDVQISLQDPVFSSFGYILRSTIA